MITAYKRGRVWWVRGSFNGVRVARQTLDTEDKKIAEKKVHLLEQEILAGINPTPWPAFESEFLALIETSLVASSRKKYSKVIRRFGQFLEARRVTHVGSITPKLITEYTQDRRNDRHPTRNITVGAEGIKSDLRILRRAFNLAVAWGSAKDNPVKMGRLGTLGGETMPYSEDEVARMLAAAPHGNTRTDLRAILLVFLYTGLRISDVIGLEKRALRFDEKVVRTKTQKRGKVVTVPMHPDLEAGLALHLREQPGEARRSRWVFPTATGERSTALDAALRRFLRRAGIQGGRAHRFRDTFAVSLLKVGASLYDVAKLLGITMPVAERHYAPYVQVLRERGRIMVGKLGFGTPQAQPEIQLSKQTT